MSGNNWGTSPATIIKVKVKNVVAQQPAPQDTCILCELPVVPHHSNQYEPPFFLFDTGGPGPTILFVLLIWLMWKGLRGLTRMVFGEPYQHKNLRYLGYTSDDQIINEYFKGQKGRYPH